MAPPSLCRYNITLASIAVENRRTTKGGGKVENSTDMIAENGIISALIKLIERTNEINKRLVIALVAVTFILSLTLFGVAALYFLADYGYPEMPAMEQTQTTTQKVNTGEGGVN